MQKKQYTPIVKKLPDLEKLRDARLRYLKRSLFAYLNVNSLKNKVTDLKEIVGYLSLDYLVLSETKLDDSFPLAQFSLPNYGIRATNSDKNYGKNCYLDNLVFPSPPPLNNVEEQ